MTGNEFDAEDVVQETFLRACRQLNSYESRSSLSTWLYRIAANYSLDLLRSRRRHEDRHTSITAEGADVLDNISTTAPGQGRMSFSAQVRQKLESALGEERTGPRERRAGLGLQPGSGNSRHHIRRGEALNWLAREAGKKATGASQNALEPDPELAVKKKAVFALSQLPRDEGVPLLINVAKSNKDSEIRKQAMHGLCRSSKKS